MIRVLWDPKKALTGFVSIHDYALNVWSFGDQFASSKVYIQRC